jgi:hypothetical protein
LLVSFYLKRDPDLVLKIYLFNLGLFQTTSFCYLFHEMSVGISFYLQTFCSIFFLISRNFAKVGWEVSPKFCEILWKVRVIFLRKFVSRKFKSILFISSQVPYRFECGLSMYSTVYSKETIFTVKAYSLISMSFFCFIGDFTSNSGITHP